MDQVLVEAKDLGKCFKVGKQQLVAVNQLNFQIYKGETLALVGESGCGKSTVGRLLLRLYTPTTGKVVFDMQDLSLLSTKQLKQMRRRMQIIFQDPFASLNPRLTVQDIVAEPLDIHQLAKGSERKERVAELLDLVGLSANYLCRFPHEFSGGQRQRIGIARALASNPEFLVCDEPISALDVSIQAQVINLLKNLQKKMGLTYLLIAHDLAVVKYLSDRVMVMYLGEMMEIAASSDLYSAPLHPYTQALLSCIPIPDPILERKRIQIPVKGEIPNPLQPPKGCPFASRCPYVMSHCHHIKPPLSEVKQGHFVACHLMT